MVFPSVPPLYLDPTTWNQNQQQLYHNYQQQVSNTGDQQQLQRPAPGTGPGPSTNMGTAPKTNSMAERARLAKIPMQPEGAPLPCPRCESTNTKFCYFNNYSLAQPRHFCKACRRYWTRGGALRNVPVGGGTRRNNKRSSKSGSGGASSSSAAKSSTSSSIATSASMLQRPPQQLQIARPMNLPVMMTSSMIDYESSSVNVPNLGLGFSNMGLMTHIQQFPFLGGLEPPPLPPPSQPAGIYPFLEGQVGGGGSGGSSTGSELMSQMESAKMEESNRRRVMNLERQYTLGMNITHPRNDHFWGEGSTTSNGGGGGGGWMANLSGFNSSTTGSLL